MFFLLLSFIGEPEDYCTTYILEKNLLTPSSLWDEIYDSSYNAFITMQGSLDEEKWYLFYKVKAEFANYKRFKMRYRYFKLSDYNDSIDVHRFEPVIRIWRENIYSYLIVVPTFDKRRDKYGFGISHFIKPIDYVEVSFSIKDFGHNAVSDTPYTYQPYIFRIDLSEEWRFGRLKGYFEYTTPWEKRYEDYKEKGKSLRTQGRIDIKYFDKLSFGGIWEYHTYSLLSGDTLQDFMIEPFLRFPLIKNSWANLQYRQTYTYKKHRSYQRTWGGISFFVEYPLSSITFFGIGYQQALRKIKVEGSGIPDPYAFQYRLVFSFELRFPYSFFTAKEALDLDRLKNVWAYLKFGNYSRALAYLHERALFGLLFHW